MRIDLATKDEYSINVSVDGLQVGYLSDVDSGRWVLLIDGDDTYESLSGCYPAEDDNKIESLAFAIAECNDAVTSTYADGLQIR